MTLIGPGPLRACALAALFLFVTTGCSSPSRRQRQEAFEARQARLEAQGEGDRGWRKRNKPRLRTRTVREFATLGSALGAKPSPIQAPCLNRLCTRRALGRLFEKFDRVDEDRQGVARILILGDSHIAADYIARAIRKRLQRRFGNAGRGFVAIDQKAQYGGRRLSKANWTRTRIVDGNGPGREYGFAGMRLDANRSGARLVFELAPDDDDVVAYFLGQPRSGGLSFYAHKERIGVVQTRNRQPASRTHRVAIPERAGRTGQPPSRLEIVAERPRAALFGLSFESYEAGVIVDAIGPVGADAQTYLQMDYRSLREHLRALDPDVVMLMVGGNDALALRKGVRTIADVERDHQRLIKRIRSAIPDTDCLIWAPLDAGVRKGKRIVSKAKLTEVRDAQRKVAKRMRCAFWDTYEAMGGRGSFARWYEKKLMNKDLIHPRARGGDLLGHLFATALMNAYLNGS